MEVTTGVGLVTFLKEYVGYICYAHNASHQIQLLSSFPVLQSRVTNNTENVDVCHGNLQPMRFGGASNVTRMALIWPGAEI